MATILRNLPGLSAGERVTVILRKLGWLTVTDSNGDNHMVRPSEISYWSEFESEVMKHYGMTIAEFSELEYGDDTKKAYLDFLSAYGWRNDTAGDHL